MGLKDHPKTSLSGAVLLVLNQRRFIEGWSGSKSIFRLLRVLRGSVVTSGLQHVKAISQLLYPGRAEFVATVSTVRGSGCVYLTRRKHPFATANGTDLSQKATATAKLL